MRNTIIGIGIKNPKLCSIMDKNLMESEIRMKYVRSNVALVESTKKDRKIYLVVVSYALMKKSGRMGYTYGKVVNCEDRENAEVIYNQIVFNVKTFRDLDLMYLLKCIQLESLKSVSPSKIRGYNQTYNRISRSMESLKPHLAIEA